MGGAVLLCAYMFVINVAVSSLVELDLAVLWMVDGELDAHDASLIELDLAVTRIPEGVLSANKLIIFKE